ncbi:MAG: holo-ACP synthase [Candidatus Aureabacteria bacterium]|nr:holo-ACP synthase [Candidatus Auribacterota bacterium]
MAIHGIGMDVVDVARMKKILARDDRLFFRKKIFSPTEIKYCEQSVNSAERYSVRFAAKEACLKAIGDPSLPLNEIIVEKKKTGKPFLVFGGSIQKRVEGYHLHLTLSHTKNYACAVVVMEE